MGLDIHTTAGLISEVLTVIGLFGGTTLLIAGLSVRAISGRWVRADGVIASSDSGTLIRWFDGDGEVHESPAVTHETYQLVPGDDVPVWFHFRTPSRCRTNAPEFDGKALRVTGLILLGTGLVAAALGIVLMFV